jgi:hypothetical protein
MKGRLKLSDAEHYPVSLKQTPFKFHLWPLGWPDALPDYEK